MLDCTTGVSKEDITASPTMIIVIQISTLENDNESTNRVAIILYKPSKAIIRFLLLLRSAIILKESIRFRADKESSFIQKIKLL